MKTILLYIASFLVVVACKKQEVDLEALDAYVKELHLATYTNVNDSTISNLYEVNRLYEANPDLPAKRLAYNNNLLGSYHRNRGNLDSAAFYYYRASEYSPDTLQIDVQREVSYFYNAWEVFNLLNQHGDALAICRKFEQSIPQGDSIKLSTLHFMYSTTYYNSNDFDNAFKFNKKRIKYESLVKPESINPGAFIREALLYYNYLSEPQKAIDIFERLTAKAEEFSSLDNRLIQGEYAAILYRQGKFKDALQAHLLCQLYTKEISDQDTSKPEYMATNYLNLSEVSIDLKEYNNAQKYLDSAMALGVVALDRDKRKEALKHELRLAVKNEKDLNKAVKLVDSIVTFFDNDYQAKYNQELVALTKANETEKELLAQQQQDQIDKLKLQTRLFLVLGFAALLIALGLLFYRQRKLRFERTSLQMQQRLLRSQMNPHFTFNTLYAIQRQIKEAPAKAHDYLLKFSRLLRLILENSMQNYVLLEDELESLRKYIDLQLLRFPDKFDYNIELVKIEEDDPLYIPPMLIQPFVENAIEHGFSGIDYKGQLTIRLEMNGKYVSCLVQDNGKGMGMSKSSNKKSASTQLISEFLTKVTGEGLKKEDLKTTHKTVSGTRVSFLIPFNTQADD